MMNAKKTATMTRNLQAIYVFDTCISYMKGRSPMTESISVEEAQAKLAELIGRLGPGEEIGITREQLPVAKLVGQRPSAGKPRVPGNCKGMIALAVEDNEHLRDFEEYGVNRLW
jgi:antitoxin (DNA-binding transcriptional repressor) of toxin-antitoxin stability system